MRMRLSLTTTRRGEPWYSCVCMIPMYHPAPPKTYLQIHMYQILYQSLHNSTGPPAAKKRSRRRWGGRSLRRHHRFCTRVYIILQGRLPPKKDPQIQHNMYLKFGRGGFPPPVGQVKKIRSLTQGIVHNKKMGKTSEYPHIDTPTF